MIFSLLTMTLTLAEPPKMVALPAGNYRPLYMNKNSPQTFVGAFSIDVTPVTNAQYLTFVINNPRWQSQQIPSIFAEAQYLQHWQQNLTPKQPSQGQLNSPVVNVSWFAAQAYCHSLNKSLPTVAQWERVASASATQPNGSLEKSYNQRILQWYSRPSSKQLPEVGTTPANYWGAQDSVYQLNSTWLDQDANKRTLSSFSGKKQVISLIYTHCLHTCPTIVSTMQAIENKLSEAEKQDVGFILVSLTPDTDTPAVLKEFAQSRKLNLQNWSLLTGTPQDVRSLAMVLNIKFQNIDNNEVNHSNLMTGLDEQGRIKFQELGVINNAAIAAEKLTNF